MRSQVDVQDLLLSICSMPSTGSDPVCCTAQLHCTPQLYGLCCTPNMVGSRVRFKYGTCKGVEVCMVKLMLGVYASA